MFDGKLISTEQLRRLVSARPYMCGLLTIPFPSTARQRGRDSARTIARSTGSAAGPGKQRGEPRNNFKVASALYEGRRKDQLGERSSSTAIEQTASDT
jgi:hypothetical protein